MIQLGVPSVLVGISRHERGDDCSGLPRIRPGCHSGLPACQCPQHPHMLRCLFLSAAGILVGCSTPTRHYRLELDPLPQGSQRQVSATMLVDGKPESIDAALPLVREWDATSLSGELSSPGPGGMRMRLTAKPEKSVERELVWEQSGPLGVSGRIIERSGAATWGIQLEMSPITTSGTPAAPVP